MKLKPLLLVLCFVLLLGGAYGVYRWQSRAQGAPGPSGAVAPVEVYTCPMHPSVRSDHPGACPICGMALVRQSAGTAASAADAALIRSVSLSPSQRIMSNISTIEAKRQTISHEIRAVGIVSFAEPLQATVAARFRGRIERLFVGSTGQKVKRGDPLFEMYSPDLITAEQEYLLAAAAATDKSAGDSSGASTPLQLFESARDRLVLNYGLTPTQVKNIQASGQALPAMLFYSPMSGTVIRKDVQQGQFVEQGSVLYSLADLSRVWVLLDVYEQDIRFIKVGNGVTLSVQAYPAENFPGRVIFIEPVVNNETRTVRVRLEVPNPRGKLRPGMYAEGEITVRKENTLGVPRQAVLNTGRQSVVWVEVAKNTFEPRRVSTGIAGETFVEILSGLRGGERVAATGGFLLDSESELSAPGPGAMEPAAHASENGPPPAAGLPADVEIRVDGGYFPEEVHVRAGFPVRLHFTRVDSSECTREVVFKSLGIRRELPTGKTTTIEFTPREAGEIRYECGMAMLEGRIVVDAQQH
jgi:Cu(I)/Ag(I) efflux system membrane fusion protein